MLSRDIASAARAEIFIEPGEAPAGGSGTIAARRGVVWVSVAKGTGLFLGLIDAAESRADGGTAPVEIPLTMETWLSLKEAVVLGARTSEALAEQGTLLSALADFHAVAFSLERLNRGLAVVDQANLERARATNRRSDEDGARQRLFNLYGLARDAGDGDGDTALLKALRIIGRHEGIDFKWPARTEASDSATLLDNALDASGVRGRRVRLDKWWIGNAGAMLAFRPDDGRPVVLLPGMFGRYREVDPVEGRSSKVTAKRAEALRSDAWLFYRPLTPAEAGPRDLLRLAGKGLTPAAARFLMAGLLGGLVMLMPAVVLGFVADKVIPRGETGPLFVALAALAAIALVGALLHVLQGTALMRLEGRATSRLEAAFWDRLLRLPPRFLHRYPAGDLAMRGMAFQTVRDAVQGVVANAVLSIVFLLPAFLLIFFYDAQLGPPRPFRGGMPYDSAVERRVTLQ